MKINIEFPRKLLEVYNDTCKPLCKKLKLPQTAFEYFNVFRKQSTIPDSRDIVKIRNIKANLISINVEKLVKEGYLRREEIKGDRRKTKLIITEKAHPVIKEGQQLQQGFVDQLFDNTTQEDKKIFIM